MTPAERQLVTELFDRLATLEDAQRDPDAERAIRDGLAQAPNAVYALVQTTLVQDEALKHADARIQELEAKLGGNEPPRQGGFLDNMRDSIWGRRPEARGSVPNVRPGDVPMGAPPQFGGPSQPTGGPGYGTQGQPMPPPEQGRGGGSFLGTAAAAAAGAIGGSLLLDSIRGMTGGGGGRSGHALADAAHGGGGSPWGNASGGGGGELARQAGLDDIGRSSGSGPSGQSQGLFDESRGGGKSGDADTRDYANQEDENFDDDDDANDDGGDDFDTGDE